MNYVLDNIENQEGSIVQKETTPNKASSNNHKKFNITRLNAISYKNSLDIYGAMHKTITNSSKYDKVAITNNNLTTLLEEIKIFMINNGEKNDIK